MIHYSVVPVEVVFEGYDQFNPKYKEIEHNGIQMVVELEEPDRAKIVRLLSANPHDYLNRSFAPGSIIQFQH